nr:hypothetical protein DA06_28620 [Georgenia sp. SUBG003]
MEPDAVLRQAAQGVVEGLDPQLGEGVVSTEGSGSIWSKFSATEGSSICRTRPASRTAWYSSRSTSAQA